MKEEIICCICVNNTIFVFAKTDEIIDGHISKQLQDINFELTDEGARRQDR